MLDKKLSIRTPLRSSQKFLIQFFGFLGTLLLILCSHPTSTFGQAAPGGVGTNLDIWLRAGSGTNTTTEGGSVDTWNDQSGNGNDGVGAAGYEATFRTANENFNFNPYIEFNGSSSRIGISNLSYSTTTIDKIQMWIVFRTDYSAGGSFTANWALLDWDRSEYWDIYIRGDNNRAGFSYYGNSIRDNQGTSALNDDKPHIISGIYDNSITNDTRIRVDGTDELNSNVEAGGVQLGNGTTRYAYVGDGSEQTTLNLAGNNIWYDGDVAEIIYYEGGTIVDTDIKKIESYLALKYGITLHGGATDYVASDGTTLMWERVDNINFDNDIAGIGRDDDSALSQTSSQSIHSDSIIKMEGATDLDDLEFLSWGNNNSVTSGWTSTGAPVGYTLLPRDWRIHESGDVGSIDVQVDAADLPSGGGAIVLLIDTDSDGDYTDSPAGAEIIGMTGTSGIWSGTYNFDDDDQFTLGRVNSSPGGVSSNLVLWVGADLGTDTTTDGASVTTWFDQSSGGNSLTAGGTQPTYESGSTDLVNNHPKLSATNLDRSFNTAGTITGQTLIAVNKPNGLASLDGLMGFNGDNGIRTHTTTTQWRTPLTTTNAGDWSDGGTAYINGVSDANHDDSWNITTHIRTASVTNTFYAGGYFAGRNYSGDLAELLVFDSSVSSSDLKKLHSYLALKYGLTLNQSGTGQDYVASNGLTVMWDATDSNSYPNNIVGIGRDDTSGLDQSTSKSTESGAIIQLSNATNLSNLEFLVISHDGSDATTWTGSGISTGFQRLAREWRVEENNGDVGTVTLSVSTADIPSTPHDLRIIVDTDSDGDYTDTSSGATIVTMSFASGTWSGTYNFSDGDTFIVAVDERPYPGGATGSLEFWFKADAGAKEFDGTDAEDGDQVTEWQDQSFNRYDALNDSSTGPEFNNAISNQINNNPAMNFVRSSAEYMYIENLFYNTTTETLGDMTIYAVGKTNAAAHNQQIIISYDRSSFYRFSVGNDSAAQPNFTGFQTTGGGTTDDQSGTTNVNDANVHLIGAEYDIANTAKRIYVDGTHEDTNTAHGGSNLGNASEVPRYGFISNGSEATANDGTNTPNNYFDGQIAEIVMYSRLLSTTERHSLESYLALKYGITRDQGLSAYLASDAVTVMWDSTDNASYANDIAGIGRDDSSGLSQTTSISINSDALISIGSPTDLQNLEFLTWGNNNAVSSSWTSTGAPTNYQRLAREWRVDESNGEVGTVTVSVNEVDLPSNGGIVLLVDTDNDGDFTDNPAGASINSMNNSGGIWSVDVDLDDDNLFTVGIVNGGPGGVSTNLRQWLMADNGPDNTTDGGAVSSWTDQSGNNNDASTTGSPVYRETSLNFKPAVDFDNDYLSNLVTTTDGGLSLFYVLNAEARGAIQGVFQQTGAAEPMLRIDAGDQYEVDGAGGGGSTITTGDVAAPDVIGVRFGSTETAIYENNVKSTGTAPTVPTGSTTYELFNSATGSRFYGNVHETIAFGHWLNDNEVLRVQSYLALKWGLTLDQTTPTPYLASDAITLMWDSTNNSSHNNDIAGLGRDDSSVLFSSRAKSNNSDAIIDISNPTDLEDLEFLVWGNDNGSIASWTSTGAPPDYERLTREWRIDENSGDVGTVTITVSGTDLPSTGGRPLSLVIDSDSDNDYTDGGSGGITILNMTVAENIWTVTHDFTDNDEFILAVTDPVSPGGVYNELRLWLKADTGTGASSDGDSITTWEDQSIQNNDAVVTNGTAPKFRTNRLNFEPAVDFVANGAMGATLTTSITGTNRAAAAFVINPLTSSSSSARFLVMRNGLSGADTGTNNHALFAYKVGASTNVAGYRNATQLSTETAGLDGDYHIVISNFNGTNHVLRWDGSANAAVATSANFSSDIVTFGGTFNTTWNNFMRGFYNEIAVFATDLDSTNINRVESYLATKYGITLDQSSPQDYVNSANSTVWDASDNVGFVNDIVGIGRDDTSGLNKTQSKSNNSDSIITLSAPSDLNNLEYLFIGNNNGVTASFTSIGAPVSFEIIERDWRVDESNGDLGTVTITVSDSDLPTTSNLKILVDTDSDGDYTDGPTGTTIVSMTKVGSDYVGSHNFDDDDQFTFGRTSISPGGIDTNLSLWLLAGKGTDVSTDGFKVGSWDDQSGNGRDFSQGSSSPKPTYQSDDNTALNGNPVLDFDGADYLQITSGSTVLASGDDATLIFVSANKDVSTRGTLFGQFNTGATAANHLFRYEATEDIEFDQDTPGGGIYNQNIPELSNNQFDILSMTRDTNRELFFNNASQGTGAIEAYSGSASTTTALGFRRDTVNSDGLDGYIAEVVIYNSSLNSSDRNRVESYLALKYGITLDQGTATNYTASDGSTLMWDATDNASFANDITGIGLDATSELNQTLSISANADRLIRIGNASDLDDTEFLSWGNNNGSIASWTTTGAPAGYEILARDWRIHETGDVGSVTLSIDGSNLPSDTSLLRLIVDTDSDGDYTDSPAGAEIVGMSVVDGAWTINYDFSDDDQFTLANVDPINNNRYSIFADMIGQDIISTSVTNISWDTTISYNTSIPIASNGIDIDLVDGGHYLITYSVPTEDSGGTGQSEIQSWLRLNDSTDLVYGRGQGYIARNNNANEGYNQGAAVVNVSANDRIRLQMQRTDSGSAIVRRRSSKSAINVIKLDDNNVYLRSRPTANQSISTTSFTDLTLATDDEIDADFYSRSGASITLETTGHYLVTYNVAFRHSGAATRTNDEARLVLDGSEIDGTRTTAYMRGTNSCLDGVASYVGVIRAASAGQVLKIQVRRESSTNPSGHIVLAANTGITITKLPNDIDFVRLGETGGGQDLSTSRSNITWDQLVEEDSLSFTYDTTNDENISFNQSGDYLVLSTLYASRVSGSTREAQFLEIRSNNVLSHGVDGTGIYLYGGHGAFNRGNPGSEVAMTSGSSGGMVVVNMSTSDAITQSQINEANNDTATYQANRMAIQMINLDSWFRTLTQDGFRLYDNEDAIQPTSALAAEGTGTRLPTNRVFRIRLALQNQNAPLSADSLILKLQYAAGSVCSVIADGSWNDVGAIGSSAIFRGYDNTTPSDGATITASLLDAGGNTFESYEEANRSIENPNTLSDGARGEWDWVVENNGGTVGDYCFRVITDSGRTIDYSEYPYLEIIEGSKLFIVD